MPFPAFFLLAAALGGREAVRGKRRERKMLDAEADRQDRINNIDLGIGAMGAGNQFDAAQLEAMQRQFQTAQGMLRSLDPKLQSIGANMLQDLDTAVRGNIQQNETEARTDAAAQKDQEIVDAGLTRDADENRLARELVMNKQINDELKSFNDATVSYNKVQNLLDNNDQLASLAGLTAFVQAIDNSVVREGELLKYQGANGFITQIVNMVNKTEGRDFDPTTKQSIRNASAALMNAEKSRATALTSSYQDRAVSFGLDANKVLSGVDETLFTPLQIDRSAQQRIQQQADDAEAAQKNFAAFSEAGQDGILQTLTNQTVGVIGEGAAILADKALQAWQQGGRELRGASLHIDPKTGDIWEQDAQGKWHKIIGTPDQQRQAEIFRLQNTEAQSTATPQDQQRADDAEREGRRGLLENFFRGNQ